MRELWEKVKENCEENKIAFSLWLAFLLFFCVLAGPDIVKETFSANVGHDSKPPLAMEETDESEDIEKTEDADDGGETEGTGEAEDIGESGAAGKSEDAGEAEDAEAKGTAGEAGSQNAAKPHVSGEKETARGDEDGTSDNREPVPVIETIPEAVAGAEDEQSPSYRILRDKFRIAGYSALEDMEKERSIWTLQRMIERRIERYDGDWSVYLKNLTTGESFIINDHPMKSASVMKLFIMGTVYKAFESGDLERTDEIMTLVNQMISLSDNESSNELLYRLGEGSYAAGIAKVDAFIEEYGFSEMTVEYNGFDNPATNTGTGNYNQVSAKDCGKLLEDIYRRTWVSRTVSNEMESMLLEQNTRYKIPAGLPEGVLCGNKTGEMDTTENDAAIIYAQECDYILVVLSSDWASKDEAISGIRSISSVAYEYLNVFENTEAQ